MDGFGEDGQRRIRSEAESGEEPEAIVQTADGEAEAEVDEGTPSVFSEWALPLGLFLLTCFTTVWAGAYQSYHGTVRGPLNFLLEHPEALWQGLPFAAALLFILTTHELGHYLLSRIHGMPASLPLFIPGPPHFIGTFGAIIRMRSPILSRRALFDIGVAGPLAGFIVAVAVLIVGLSLSTVVDRTATSGLHLGEPLLLQFLAWVVIGPISRRAGADAAHLSRHLSHQNPRSVRGVGVFVVDG
ncbi:MAG: site-2 protease family protein [Nitrospira sp.]|nr:site-2 protease family protein [Nitrospira sp.]